MLVTIRVLRVMLLKKYHIKIIINSHYLKCDYRSFNDIMRVNKYNNYSYYWL